MTRPNSISNEQFISTLPERQQHNAAYIAEAVSHESFNEKDYWENEDKDREERENG